MRYLNRTDKSLGETRSCIIELLECQLQLVNDQRKTVGDEATTSELVRNGNGTMHENAALHHVCTCFVRWVDMFREVVWLPYIYYFAFLSHQLDKTHTLKLNLS